MTRKNKKGKRVLGKILLIVVLLFIISYISKLKQESSKKNDSIAQDQLASIVSRDKEWNLVLVNPDHKLPKHWDIELTELANGERVDSRIYPDLQQMFDDMRAQGVFPTVASGYRTSDYQRELMDKKIEELRAQGYSLSKAKAEAQHWVAKDGYSEHQTGLAVDINADRINSSGDQVYQWLADQAWQYGFILRYPQGKEDITGTSYEPWHYRYVGKEAAKVIHEQAICLEEYIDSLN